MRRIERAEAIERVQGEHAALPPRFAGCSGCALAAGYPPELETLASNDVAVAVLDRYATRRGHVLIVLRRHAESIAELTWDDYAAVQRLAWEATRAIERTFAPRRVYVAALGASQPLATSFSHQHIHVIPLYDGGDADRPSQVFTWANGVMMYEADEAATLAAALRATWSAASDGQHS